MRAKRYQTGARRFITQVSGILKIVKSAWHLGVWLFLLLLITAACNSAPDLETPPEIRYGEDACDRCLMIINEARFSASYVTGTGDVRLFDDIGGMFDYTQEVPENVVVFWVHDYETEEWLKGKDAFYVAADGLRTPMGFDIVAFSTEAQAQNFVVESGGVMHTFESLMALAVAGEIELAHEHRE